MADNSIALQVQTPNAMNTIGNVLNIANQSIALKKAQATLQPDIERSKAESSSAQTASEFARWKLDETQAQKAYEIAGSLTTDPAIVSGDSEGSVKALMEAEDRMRAYGIPENKIKVQMGPMYAMAAHNPKQLQQTLKNVIAGGLSASGQASAITPSGPMMNTGQVQQQVNTNPLAGPNAPVPGTTVQNVLPPSTPTVDAQGNPVYLGPTSQPKPVAAGPKLGVTQNVAGTVDTVNKHYQGIVEESNKAAQDVGVLQNIKKYAPGAVSGVASDRRAYLAGLAGLLGMDAEQLSKTNTDLLAKESNMLALAGGDTNLAKMMAESANPNVHMTKEAITKAADRVISMRELAIEKQHFFQGLKGDPNAYNSQLSEWNKHADPRVLQYRHMSKDEKVEMRSAMSEKEAKEFASHLRWFEDKGILR